jgi:hypothetical protein
MLLPVEEGTRVNSSFSSSKRLREIASSEEVIGCAGSSAQPRMSSLQRTPDRYGTVAHKSLSTKADMGHADDIFAKA